MFLATSRQATQLLAAAQLAKPFCCSSNARVRISAGIAFHEGSRDIMGRLQYAADVLSPERACSSHQTVKIT